jgi:hypothetical protein
MKVAVYLKQAYYGLGAEKGKKKEQHLKVLEGH